MSTHCTDQIYIAHCTLQDGFPTSFAQPVQSKSTETLTTQKLHYEAQRSTNTTNITRTKCITEKCPNLPDNTINKDKTGQNPVKIFFPQKEAVRSSPFG